MKKILIACLILICPTLVFAALPVSQSWDAAFFGGASTFNSITWDNTTAGKVYATTDVGGMYVSTDSGATWEHVGRNFPCVEVEQLIQSTSNPNYFYAACGNSSYNAGYTGIYYSHNGGSSWGTSATTATWSYKRPTHYKPIAVDHANPLIVYAATPIISGHNYIYKSIDGAVTWELFDTDPFATEIVNLLISHDSKWLYATTSASSGANVKVYDRENDTDETYTLTGTEATYNSDIASAVVGSTETVCVAAGLKLACSSNGMATISYSAESHATKRIHKFDMMVDGASIWIMAADPTAYAKPVLRASKNGGTSWTTPTQAVAYDTVADPTTASPDARYESAVHALSINPNNHSMFLSTSAWGIWKSSDWAENITNSDNGAANIVTSEVTVAPNGWLFAGGMDIGLNKSTDKGVTWTNVFGHNATYNYTSTASTNWAGHVWRIATVGTEATWNAGAGVIYATFTGWSVDASAFLNNFVRSTDSGATWAKIATGFPTAGESIGKNGISYMQGLAVCPQNEATVAVMLEGNNGGIWISDDSGATFTKSAFSSTADTMVRALAFDPTDATCQKMAMGRWGDTGVRVTTDRFGTASTTWTTQVSDLAYRPGTSTIYSVGSDAKLYKGGTAIKTFTDTEGNASVTATLYFDPSDSEVLFVSTDYPSKANAVWMTSNISADASATWTDITYDLPSRQGAFSIVKNYKESTSGWLYIATKGNGVFKLNFGSPAGITYNGVNVR